MPTLKIFRSRHAVGRYLASVVLDDCSHAVAVIDGKLVAGDPNAEFSNRRVELAFRLVD